MAVATDSERYLRPIYKPEELDRQKPPFFITLRGPNLSGGMFYVDSKGIVYDEAGQLGCVKIGELEQLLARGIERMLWKALEVRPDPRTRSIQQYHVLNLGKSLRISQSDLNDGLAAFKDATGHMPGAVQLNEKNAGLFGAFLERKGIRQVVVHRGTAAWEAWLRPLSPRERDGVDGAETREDDAKRIADRQRRKLKLNKRRGLTDSIRAFYKQGKSKSEIAKILDCSYQQVYQATKSLPKPDDTPNPNGTVKSPYQVQDITTGMKAALEGGESVKDVAKKFEVKYQKVYALAKKLGKVGA